MRLGTSEFTALIAVKKIIYKPLLNIFGFVCVGLNKYTGRKLPLELELDVGAQLLREWGFAAVFGLGLEFGSPRCWVPTGFG